jgi:hypothetical protein
VTGPVTNTAPTVAKNELGRAFVIGVAAAVLGGGIWYGVAAATSYHVGLVAIVVGALVGVGVAYEQVGRDRVPLQAMAVLLTLVALFFAEYFIVRHAAIDALSARGRDTNIALFLSPGDMIQVVQDDISDDPSILLFAAIAVFQAWRIPAMGRR